MKTQKIQIKRLAEKMRESCIARIIRERGEGAISEKEMKLLFSKPDRWWVDNSFNVVFYPDEVLKKCGICKNKKQKGV